MIIIPPFVCLILPPSITEVPDFRVVNQGWKSSPPTLLPLPIPFGTENNTKGPEQNPKTQNSLNKDNDINFIYLFIYLK
jgi:hypothetical protein